MACRIGRRDRAIGDTARCRLHLDHRLQPVEAARSVPHDLDRGIAIVGGGLNGGGNRVAVERDRAGVARE